MSLPKDEKAAAKALAKRARRDMSQGQRILSYLRRGVRLTPMDALTIPDIASLRLGARVWDLRREGHNIIGEYKTLENGKRVMEYRLADADVKPPFALTPPK